MKKAWKIVLGVVGFFVVFYIFAWIFPNADYEKIGEGIGGLIPLVVGYYVGNRYYKKWREKKNKQNKS